MSKVTVYIVSHNYGNYVQEAIESVLRQTFEDWELLLFNDNSSDNTDEVFNLYKSDKRISIYKTEGIGLPGVCNFALRKANGKYIIRLDGDDFFDENILLVLTHNLDNNKSNALVFPDYYLIDSKGGVFAQEQREKVFQSNHVFDIPAHGACTLIRKKVLIEIGGYRTDLGAQDGFDLWTRIISNYKCSNVNLPLFYYRRHGANLTEKHHHIFNARREIKKDASISKMEKYKSITAIIPCRESYDIIPNLWKEELDEGLTLLDVAIQNCINSKLFDKIVVTSDNKDVTTVMDKYHDKRLKFVYRESKLTIRSMPISETLSLIVNQEKIEDSGLLILVFLQSPFINYKSIEEGIYSLVLNDADSAFAVEEISKGLYKRDSHGLVPLNSKHLIRTDFDIIYGDSRNTVVTTVKNINKGSLLGAKTVNYITPQRENLFIQTKFDLDFSKYKYLLDKDDK